MTEPERPTAPSEADIARQQVEHYKRLVAERDATIEALYASKSWKMTAPLRAGLALVERLKIFPRALRLLNAQYGGPRGTATAIWKVATGGGVKSLWFRTNLVLRNVHATRGQIDPYIDKADPWGEANGDDLQWSPLISVLMPTHNTPREMLDAAIWSVRRQTYPHWELVIVDDASTGPHVREVIQSHAHDHRVKVSYQKQNGNISKTLNVALGIARGEFMTVLDHDDLLHPKALYGVARTVNDHPKADYIYSDEDKVSADGSLFFGPFYKPDWSPEYLHSLMYTCHLSAFRMSIVRQIGGYRSEFDGAQDLDFTLRYLLKTQSVKHIPRVLYHWRVWENSTALTPDAKPLAEGRAREALRQFLEASGENFEIGPGPRAGHHEVRFLPRGEPLISIVIPTANAKIEIHGRTEWHIDAVIDSVNEKSTYRNFEIIAVHNNDLREEQVRRFEAMPNVRLIEYKYEKFNLAEKINLGCEHARGEYLVLLNDDIRVITPQWLELMLGMAQRKGVGAVGPKLLFPDNTIQHAGVLVIGGCPGHAYYQWPIDAEGYGMGAIVARNYLAVTGACVMTPTSLYKAVGGFALKYRMNYNDVDYCLKLHELGYRSVYMPQAVLYHYEGVSRDGGRSVEINELETFLADWHHKFRHDPYYNPNLSQHAPYVF